MGSGCGGEFGVGKNAFCTGGDPGWVTASDGQRKEWILRQQQQETRGQRATSDGASIVTP
jgi:hypothetical protein